MIPDRIDQMTIKMILLLFSCKCQRFRLQKIRTGQERRYDSGMMDRATKDNEIMLKNALGHCIVRPQTMTQSEIICF